MKESTGPKQSSWWCPVCEGFGGWDWWTSALRTRKDSDNPRTYVACLWCSGNAIVSYRHGEKG